MKRDDRAYVADILTAAGRIRDFLKGVSRSAFDMSALVQSGVVYQLIVIGEAASSLTDEFKTARADVEWPKIVGLRNIAIHTYWSVSTAIVWDAARRDVPNLAKKLAPPRPPRGKRP